MCDVDGGRNVPRVQGTTSGSVQATDRLLKELREIYRSDNFKHGISQF